MDCIRAYNESAPTGLVDRDVDSVAERRSGAHEHEPTGDPAPRRPGQIDLDAYGSHLSDADGIDRIHHAQPRGQTMNHNVGNRLRPDVRHQH